MESSTNHYKATLGVWFYPTAVCTTKQSNSTMLNHSRLKFPFKLISYSPEIPKEQPITITHGLQGYPIQKRKPSINGSDIS